MGAHKTHGFASHPIYGVWRAMCKRCHEPTWANYQWYGGRGIQVCQEWRESIAAFWRDMGPTYKPGLQIDRRDNDGDYQKDNCRWTSARENCQNRRNNIFVNTPKGRMLMADAAAAFGLAYTTLYSRIRAGCPESRLFAPPQGTH